MGVLSELFGREKKIITEMRRLDLEAMGVMALEHVLGTPIDFESDTAVAVFIEKRVAYIAARIKPKYGLTDKKIHRLFERQVLPCS